jgi:hypothetical protein
VLYYVLGDQLGSASVTLDSDGNVTGERRFSSQSELDPFGETRMAYGSSWDALHLRERTIIPFANHPQTRNIHCKTIPCPSIAKALSKGTAR